MEIKCCKYGTWAYEAFQVKRGGGDIFEVKNNPAYL
jgi:hypothetical protein